MPEQAGEGPTRAGLRPVPSSSSMARRRSLPSTSSLHEPLSSLRRSAGIDSSAWTRLRTSERALLASLITWNLSMCKRINQRIWPLSVCKRILLPSAFGLMGGVVTWRG